MQLYTSNIGTRISGMALGVGYFVIGVFALSVSGEAPNAAVADRAFWLGATFLCRRVGGGSVLAGVRPEQYLVQPTQSCFSPQIGAKVEIAGAEAAGRCWLSGCRPPAAGASGWWRPDLSRCIICQWTFEHSLLYLVHPAR